MLGLWCCTWAFSGWASEGYFQVAVCGLLTVLAFLIAECTLRSHGTWAYLLHSIWDLPNPRIEPPELAGGFFTVRPPGKPPCTSTHKHIHTHAHMTEKKVPSIQPERWTPELRAWLVALRICPTGSLFITSIRENRHPGQLRAQMAMWASGVREATAVDRSRA